MANDEKKKEIPEMASMASAIERIEDIGAIPIHYGVAGTIKTHGLRIYVCAPAPNVELGFDACEKFTQERYKSQFQLIVNKGINPGLMTSPKHLDKARETDGTLPDDPGEVQRRMQAAMDVWIPGAREKKDPAIKAKAQAVTAAEKATGTDISKEISGMTEAQITEYFINLGKKLAKKGK